MDNKKPNRQAECIAAFYNSILDDIKRLWKLPTETEEESEDKGNGKEER